MATPHPFRAAQAAAPRSVPWRRVGVLALLCSGVAVAALPRAGAAASPEVVQWQALGIAPLSAGGRTGIRMAATEAVEPIDVAPERPRVELAMTLGSGDSMRALLTRAGATYGDAGYAAAMIAAAGKRLAPGTRVSVVLGPRNGASR